MYLYNDPNTFGLSSERSLARLKPLLNKNEEIRMKTETNERPVGSP
jgi:hypothetical protein